MMVVFGSEALFSVKKVLGFWQLGFLFGYWDSLAFMAGEFVHENGLYQLRICR